MISEKSKPPKRSQLVVGDLLNHNVKFYQIKIILLHFSYGGSHYANGQHNDERR